MSTHNVKNYTEQGGEITHIGGKLVFDEGGSVEGLPSSSAAENQSASTAGSVAALKTDFNSLLVKLKEAGLMAADTWNLSARLAPALTDEVAAANNAKSALTFSDNTITITADVSKLEESESSSPGQGTHKWLGLGIGTGLSTCALAKYSGYQLTDADAEEAVSVGLDQPGEFVLYIKAEVVSETPVRFTLDADGYDEVTVTVNVVDTPSD